MVAECGRDEPAPESRLSTTSQERTFKDERRWGPPRQVPFAAVLARQPPRPKSRERPQRRAAAAGEHAGYAARPEGAGLATDDGRRIGRADRAPSEGAELC